MIVIDLGLTNFLSMEWRGMDIKELEALIRFHQAGLDQYRQHISPSAQYLEEQTIKALEGLLEDTKEAEKGSEAIREARRILEQGKQQ